MRSRPTSVTVAAIMLAVISIVNLVPKPTEGVPAVVVYGVLVLGVAGLVAVAGLWRLRRWAPGSLSRSARSTPFRRRRGYPSRPTPRCGSPPRQRSRSPPSSSCWWCSRPRGALSRPPEFPGTPLPRTPVNKALGVRAPVCDPCHNTPTTPKQGRSR